MITFREFFSLYEDECTVISADNKAKIPIGIPVVNRLVSLRQKFFMTGESPNFPDHDVQRSGSLINPEGYMILESHCNEDELEMYEEEVQDIQVDLQEEIYAVQQNYEEVDLINYIPIASESGLQS